MRRLRGKHLDSERGSAIVEFCYLAVLLMIPLAYALLAVFRVQAASYAVAAASREAGRAFVVAPDDASAPGAAYAAAQLAAGDHGIELGAEQVSLACRPDPGCSLAPGQQIDVRVAVQVPLPLVPDLLRGALPASFAVSGQHVETVDRFRAEEP